jgi:hypothetical protein
VIWGQDMVEDWVLLFLRNIEDNSYKSFEYLDEKVFSTFGSVRFESTVNQANRAG